MRRRGMTVREAAEDWVRGMNAIQQGMIAALMRSEPDKWQEVTVPMPGNEVYVYDIPAELDASWHRGEIISYDNRSDLYRVELHGGGKEISVKSENFEVEHYDSIPMWGTMWSFEDSVDDYWLDNMDGIRLMSECGFRILKHEEFGYFFGIDGAGYDFYESHWIPLYKARGLQRHDSETEREAS